MISDRINARRMLFGIPLEFADWYFNGTASGNSLAPVVLALIFLALNHRFLENF